MQTQQMFNHTASAQWVFQSQTQGMALLPSVPASRNPQSIYNSNLKTQAQLQTQQIDAAIHLLKMQYDAIMASVENSNSLSLEDGGAHAHSCRPESLHQRSFAAQFELPCPESVGVQLGSGPAADTGLQSNGLRKKRNLQAMQSMENPSATAFMKSVDISGTSEKKKALKQASQ